VKDTILFTANQKAIQIVEATADNLGLGVTQQGFGRVNFWKAVLTAANGHLSSQQGRGPGGAGSCAPFDTLDVTADSSGVLWYGFEIRTAKAHPRASVWLNIGNGTFTPLGQSQNPLPVNFQNGPGQVDPYPIPAMTYAAVPHWDAINEPPFMPWGLDKLPADAEVAVCLSVSRSVLHMDDTNPVPLLEVYAEGADPRIAGHLPAIISVPVDSLKSRTPGPNIKEFSNYVYVIEE